jgi:hypothetical protein
MRNEWFGTRVFFPRLNMSWVDKGGRGGIKSIDRY